MTDRAQAGSAGHRSQKNIELMQNRRHNGFDDYGLFSALNDKDSNNRGIQIKATYQMQIFRTSKTTSSESNTRPLLLQQLRTKLLFNLTTPAICSESTLLSANLVCSRPQCTLMDKMRSSLEFRTCKTTSMERVSTCNSTSMNSLRSSSEKPITNKDLMKPLKLKSKRLLSLDKETTSKLWPKKPSGRPTSPHLLFNNSSRSHKIKLFLPRMVRQTWSPLSSLKESELSLSSTRIETILDKNGIILCI